MTKNFANPVLCAIDTADFALAKALAASLASAVGGLKLGLEFFGTHGPAGVEQVIAGRVPFFLDLKFHDIPNTVAGAVASVMHLKPAMFTVHTSGGRAMLEAASESTTRTSSALGIDRPLVLGVTVLTSLDLPNLRAIGIGAKMEDQVLKLAGLALDSGLDGVVCSPREIAPLRRQFGNALKLVVPGIRPTGADIADQKRVTTPAKAIADGADFLVIGRPITGARDPAAAARQIVGELNSG